MPTDATRWNHNIQYHPVVLAAVPQGCRRALDVGCGEGQLTRELQHRVQHVIGLDRDAASIELARARAVPGLEYVAGDLLTHPFEAESFDLVASVASLHHMDAGAGLTRMAALLRPGGVLVVIGLARSRLPADLPRELAAVVGHRVHTLTKPVWEHPSPKVWSTPETYAGLGDGPRTCYRASTSAGTCSGATRWSGPSPGRTPGRTARAQRRVSSAAGCDFG